MSIFVSSRIFDCPIDDIFNWHKGLMAFERITPPWDQIKVLNKISSDGIFLKDGELTLKQKFLPFVSFNWKIGHKNYQQNRIFEGTFLPQPRRGSLCGSVF